MTGTKQGRAFRLGLRDGVMFHAERESGVSYAEMMSSGYAESMRLAESAPRQRQPSASQNRPASSKPERRCFRCGGKVPLHAQVVFCHCNHVFCDAHRRPELHACPFDYQADQRARLRRQNQPLRREAKSITDFQAWEAEYRRDHAVASVYARAHAVATALLLALLARVLLLVVWRGTLVSAVAHAALGAALPFCVAHGLPALCLRWQKRIARPMCGGDCRARPPCPPLSTQTSVPGSAPAPLALAARAVTPWRFHTAACIGGDAVWS